MDSPPAAPDPPPTSPFASLNRNAGAAALAIVVALATVFALARPRRTETPSWDPARFQTVRAPLASASVPAETWVIAVQIRCPHCREVVERVHRIREATGARIETIALLVDTSVAPDSSDLAHVQDAAAVYWDRENAWRTWGGTRWGDTFRFDRRGHFTGMLKPLDDSTGVARVAARLASAR